MDRREAVLKYINMDQKGLEIGPWFNPLVPKRDGYHSVVLDVFDTETLRERARNTPSIHPSLHDRIEEVDVVGSSTHIDELIAARGELGTYDYIVSSHNFEHLPNPIRFLQGCAKVLKPGGMISMAIPDRRACFDYFRPVTTLSAWIEPYLKDVSAPSRGQYFDMVTCTALYDLGTEKTISFHRNVDPEKVSLGLRLDESLAEWTDPSRDGQYHDTHCSVFTPTVFEMLIRDIGYLGLAPFEVVDVFDSPGVEFYAHLRLTEDKAVLRPADYEGTRNRLMHRILEEAAETSEMAQHAKTTDARIAELNQQLEVTSSLREQLAALERLQEERRAEIERLAARGRALEDHLNAIRASTSWRITLPMRKLVSLLRGKSA